jgi:hypothetical protein
METWVQSLISVCEGLVYGLSDRLARLGWHGAADPDACADDLLSDDYGPATRRS